MENKSDYKQFLKKVQGEENITNTKKAGIQYILSTIAGRNYLIKKSQSSRGKFSTR